jgi:hypothetical protein
MTPERIGEIALLTFGGILLGDAIAQLWPRSKDPQFFAIPVPFAAVAILACMGSAAAAFAPALLAVVAMLALFAGIM